MGIAFQVVKIGSSSFWVALTDSSVRCRVIRHTGNRKKISRVVGEPLLSQRFYCLPWWRDPASNMLAGSNLYGRTRFAL
jgi:hypothetical protein